jgi:ATP-dependent Clp protease ATP-binding subunit ClpA
MAVLFERFTDRSRRVVVLAQEEARLLNHNYIGTEHILLGLIREGEGVAAQALESMGIALEAVRHELTELIGQGGGEPTGHIPFTPRAKKVLELALREALQLGHNYIGTEHILLGLIREGEGVAAQVLVKLGADLATVRQQVIQSLSGYTGSSIRIGSLSTPAVERAQAFARGVAHGGPVRSHDLLLGLLGDENSLAARVLASLGVSLDAVRERLGQVDVAGTSDELPEEAGGRHVTVRVADGHVHIDIDDADVADLLAQAITGATGQSGDEVMMRGDDPSADFAGIWTAVRSAAGRVLHRRAQAK